jgi:hypothetical protein
MDPFINFVSKSGFLLDGCGVIGLGLLALAAVRLSKRYHSWGGSLLACGSLLLLLGRLWAIVAKQMLTAETAASLGRTWSEVLALTPFALLTAGLAGVVWGLWGHEQWLRADR